MSCFAMKAEQRRWIEEHGGNLSGYIARYGSAQDENHYGDGGELIYAADKAALEKLMQDEKLMQERKR